MDASSSTRLPPGVASTRLPTWLLPSLPPSSLDKLRPDMLIFHGLSLSRFSSISTLLSTHDPTTIAELKASCILHVVELTHTADAAYNDTILSKRAQHHALVAALLADKWTLATSITPPPSLPNHLQFCPPPLIPTISAISPPSLLPPVSLSSPPTSLSHHVHILILTHSCTLSRTISVFLTTLLVPSHANVPCFPPSPHTLSVQHTPLSSFVIVLNVTLPHSHILPLCVPGPRPPDPPGSHH